MAISEQLLPQIINEGKQLVGMHKKPLLSFHVMPETVGGQDSSKQPKQPDAEQGITDDAAAEALCKKLLEAVLSNCEE